MSYTASNSWSSSRYSAGNAWNFNSNGNANNNNCYNSNATVAVSDYKDVTRKSL